jgi:hypothetical protein
MWIDDKTPVCPGCWGTEHTEWPRDYLGTGETHICCNPECLVGWFNPDDPDDQPGDVMLLTGTVIRRGEDGRVVVDTPPTPGE